MTKEQCSLQPNYYGSSCDFQDLQSAVQQLTTKSDAQFEELKNEKWFHRIFNMVVCPRKNNIRMAEQITSLAQAQGILIEILVRLADQDANIAGMVMQSQSDIRALAQNSAYLQERLYLLEDKSYGIKENENLKDLNSQQRNILSGCLNEASKLYAMPSNEQRLYANELLNYLNADAQVANLEDALDDLEDNAKRKILSCIITYMYLYDHTAESMEQDEQEDFIDLFDLGRKTIKSLKQQTVDTYRLRGVDGCIDRYITAPIEITEETPFEVELPEPKAAEGASEAQAEENGEEAIDTNAPREKLVLSGSIQNDGETVYKNKEIHFSSAIMNCKGTVKFINCTIHYNEDSGSHIFLGDGAALLIASSTVVCHGVCEFSNISTGKINSIEDLNNFGAQEYFNGNAPHDLQMLGIKGSVIEFGAADKKFANANHPNKIVRCIFNNIHICPTQSYYYNHGSWKVLGTENQSNFMISVKIFEYEKFDYPRAVVSDCSFTNCFAASDSLINEYFDFKPVFSKNRYYRLIRQENNYGLNNMRNPSDFVESNNVKLKETNASGKKIGSSMPVEWDDSEYTTCKMATTWLNTFNKA